MVNLGLIILSTFKIVFVIFTNYQQHFTSFQKIPIYVDGIDKPIFHGDTIELEKGEYKVHMETPYELWVEPNNQLLNVYADSTILLIVNEVD